MEFTTIPNTLHFLRLHAFAARDVRIIPKEGKPTGLFQNTDSNQGETDALLSAVSVAEWISGQLFLPVLRLQGPTRGKSHLWVVTPGLRCLQPG